MPKLGGNLQQLMQNLLDILAKQLSNTEYLRADDNF